jgi:uroporphyrinogen-III decarboxylase
MAGVETVSFMGLEDSEGLQSLIDFMKQHDESAYQIAAKAPAEFAMFPDNLSSDLISPQFFRTYSLEYYKERTLQLHKFGKYTMVHIDGLLRGLLPLVAESGVMCAEAITPKPIGDVEMGDLRPMAGDSLILWGGVPGAMLIPDYPEENLKEHVIKYLETMKQNSCFVLGIGDQLPPDGDIQRIAMIAGVVNKYGVY